MRATAAEPPQSHRSAFPLDHVQKRKHKSAPPYAGISRQDEIIPIRESSGEEARDCMMLGVGGYSLGAAEGVGG